MTPLRDWIDAGLERCKRPTPGGWVLRKHGPGSKVYGEITQEDNASVVAELYEPIAIIPADDVTHTGMREVRANALFIINARQDLPRALAIVRALADLIDSLPYENSVVTAVQLKGVLLTRGPEGVRCCE
jgi:hypothetical protein